MRKYLLVLIGIFVVVFMLCGAVSATSYYVSPNGKTISVKYKYVNSTLKDQVTVTKTNGAYGYGYYGVFKTAGYDIKGTKINRTAVFFNKYHNYFYFSDFKYANFKASYSDGSWSNSFIQVTSNSLMTETMNGKTYNGLIYSGKGNYTLYYLNGQRLVKNAVMTAKFYNNGILYATVTSTDIPIYQYYRVVKETSTTNTLYANKDTRKSVITTLYTINSSGALIWKKISGISSGIEKVGGATVTYTGKIFLSTKYDPKDTWSGKYVNGDYYETKTSTSPYLVRRIPIEALVNSIISKVWI